MNKKIKSFEATSDSARFERLFDKIGVFKDAPNIKRMLLEESWSKSKIHFKGLIDKMKGLSESKLLSIYYIPSEDHSIMINVFVDRDFEEIFALNCGYVIDGVAEDRLLWSPVLESEEADSSPELPLQKAKDFFNKMESLVENRE